MTQPLPMLEVVSAEGVRIKLADGRELLDGMASWWSVIHGYNHPVLNRAIEQQLQKMAHVMFGGLTHQPAIALGKLLVDITPEPLQHVFFSDSGSVAVEVAIKMALQYWYAQGQAQKTRLLSFTHGYHGDTFGAMSVTDPGGMHQLFQPVLAPQLFAPAPSTPFGETCTPEDLAEVAALLQKHHHELAAVIIEPVLQGAGGMRFYSADYLQQLRRLCDEFNVLLIADEIATGFGRTGKLFACHHADISPDILCLGKGLTGGYMTLAATLCTTNVAQGISSGEPGVFMHGPTFMANPLACSVALASIRLLLGQEWQENIQRIETALQKGFEPARSLPGVADVRVLGGVGVIEMQEAVDTRTLQPGFVEAGVWVRPFGKLVYVMPPYVMDNADLAFLCQQIILVLQKHAGSPASGVAYP